MAPGEDGCAVSTKPFTGSAHLVYTGVPDADVSVKAEEMPVTFTGGMGEVSYDYAAKKTDVVINLGEKTYQLYEASAPEGYEKDEKVYDITFCYLNSSVPKVAISATIPNTAVVEEVPETVTVRRKVSAGIRHGVSSNTELAANAKTSDAGNLPLQAGSTLFAALGIATCGAFRKKRTNI
jgi:hypothetical protein